MSNNDGMLTDEQHDAFKRWLDEKSKSHKCPICENNDWTIGPNFIQGRTFGELSYPQVFIICNNCAYTRTFMAVKIEGLFES